MNDDHIKWLAMQYVLDELSDIDRDAFELRLLDDLSACEAVAEASRLSLLMRVAVKQAAVVQVIRPMPVVISGRSLFVARAAALVVASMIVCVGLWTWNFSNYRGPRTYKIAAELVSRWRSGMTSSEIETDVAEEEFPEVSTEVSIPEWLLAGVSLEKRPTVEAEREEIKDN